MHDVDFDIVKDMLFLKSGQFQSHQKERKGLHPPPQTKDKHKNRYVLLCRPELSEYMVPLLINGGEGYYMFHMSLG